MNGIFLAHRSSFKFARLSLALVFAMWSGFTSAGPQNLTGECRQLLALHIDNVQDYYNITSAHYLHLVESRHLTAMEQRYSEKYWSMAAKEMLYVLSKVPNHPKALVKLTNLYGLYAPLDRDAVALRFRCAIQINPHNAATRLLYGVHLHRHESVDEGIGQYREALNISPNYAEAHYNMALALIEKGANEDAKKHGIRAYELGYPLPGVRRKLKELGAWP